MGLFKKKETQKKNTQMQEAVLTLYASRKDAEIVSELLEKLFGRKPETVVKDGNELLAVTLQDGTQMQFSVLANTRENAVQSKGMANFFSQAPMENEQVKEAAIQQILLFNCIIGITFGVNEDANRTNYIVGSVYHMAEEMGAFVLHPNMYLYRADGKLLISIDGKTDLEEFYASTQILEKEQEKAPADKARKERSIAILKEKGIPYAEHLQVAVLEAECRIPDKAEIVHRLVSVFAASVRSEVFTCGSYEDAWEKANEQQSMLEENYHIEAWMSPEEKAYITNQKPTMSEHNKFGWRYECCSVLLWALSLIELKEPTEICDATELGGIIWNNDFDSLMEKAVLRSQDELLDMQDLVLRYNWACVDARINHKELTQLNGEIIYEWHYALNWLVGADGNTQWDEVRTHT